MDRWRNRCRLLLLLSALALACGPVSASAQSVLRQSLNELLDAARGAPQSGQALLLSNMQGALRLPQRDSALAELMERARSRDVIAPADDAAFAQQNVDVGLWHSGFFVDNYGTALFLSAPFDDERVPVVLVHGINGSPRDFDAMRDR